MLTQAKDASLRACMVEQQAEIDQKFRAHDVSLQATISSGCDEFHRLHQALESRVTGGETGASKWGGKGAGSERRVNSLLDPRCSIFPTMPETCSVEQFKMWRHDGLAFLEANPRWSQASRVLHEIWKSAAEVGRKVCQQAAFDVNHAVETEAGSGEFHSDLWRLSFEERAKELYQLVWRILSLSCFTDYKQIDSMNGFELWRQVSRAKDPIRKDVDFHLNLAIQPMGRTCESSFDGTYSRLLKFEKARKTLRQTTGEVCPTDLLSQVLFAFADDETTDKMDKEEECKFGDYEPMREWMSRRWENQAARTTV